MSFSSLQRHALVYCTPACIWDGAIHAVDAGDVSVIKDWIGQGHPLIARMRRENDPARHIALGLPMPLDRGKKRIALTIVPSAVERIEAPPLLHDVLNALSASWQSRMATLSRNFLPHTNSVRVVGSLAWQALTGKTYLHPKSDIDLLVSVVGMNELQAVLDLLIGSDLSPGPRIDGEIVLHNGEAVSWRELCNSSRDVLVKTLDGPKACLRGEWLNNFRERVA